MSQSLRRVAILVGALNLAYFGVEFAVALRIGSVSLFADSVDFLEDASINGLIALALHWSAAKRARLGFVLAGVILVPSAATVWTGWDKLHRPLPPAPGLLMLAGLGALVINLACALLWARFRKVPGSLTQAAFLSARNDTIANVAIIVVGFVTAHTHSGWGDLVVGLGIAALNADAARAVWSAARAERRTASAGA